VSLKADLDQYKNRVESELEQRLQHSSIQDSLQLAMRYSVLNGGKRIRPALIYLTNQALNGDIENADAAACAIEVIHSYSLVHDDLPAMDNDDLRRGKPTCHIAFDEATAILAGDALQCIAFEWLANQHNELTDQRKLKMLSILAKSSGDNGMIAGQAFDLAHVDKALTLSQLEDMHRFKTGALISASIELGILSSNQDIALDITYSLSQYAQAIGLAFQVQDDILDVIGDAHIIGKPQGSDQAANKPTYPALLGLDGAKAKLAELHKQAIEATLCLGDKGKKLRDLAQYIIERDH
jgi:geranylgeranyl pyrophosphate synthase